jgi:hypothetical protein
VGGGSEIPMFTNLEGRSLVNQGQNPEMGRGLSKKDKKILTSFMDGPYSKD